MLDEWLGEEFVPYCDIIFPEDLGEEESFSRILAILKLLARTAGE